MHPSARVAHSLLRFGAEALDNHGDVQGSRVTQVYIYIYIYVYMYIGIYVYMYKDVDIDRGVHGDYVRGIWD